MGTYSTDRDLNLTPRMKQVLALLRRGYSTDGVALELSVTPAHANNLIWQTMRRLGVHTRKEALAAYDRRRDDRPTRELLTQTIAIVDQHLRALQLQLATLDDALDYPRRFVALHADDDDDGI